MSLPIVMYGSTVCDDTQRIREQLRLWGITFEEVNIDHSPLAEQFVVFINGGYRSTPTIVLGQGKLKTIITEPSESELHATLVSAGYR